MSAPSSQNDSEARLKSRQVIASSALLKEFPWNSEAVFHHGPWTEYFEKSPWAQDFVTRMHHFECNELVRSAHDTFRKELRLGQEVSYTIARQSQSEADDSPLFENAKQTFAIATMLLNYRVLDIAAWVQNIDNKRLSSVSYSQRRGKLPTKQLSRVGYSSLEKDWKIALASGINDIRQSWHLLFPTETREVPISESDADPVFKLFYSANRRLLASRAFKIIQNFEVAAFHLAYLLKGHLDLPDDFEELKMELLSLRGGSSASLDMVDAHMKTLRSLRLPLQVALAISPLYWLVGVNLVRELDRGALVKSWAGLGGQKPTLLAQVEYCLWKALIEVATGSASLQTSLATALVSISELDLNLVGSDDIEWFTSSDTEPMSKSRLIQSFASTPRAEDCGQAQIHDSPQHHDSQSPPRSSSGSRQRTPSSAPEDGTENPIADPSALPLISPFQSQAESPSSASERREQNPVGNQPEHPSTSPTQSPGQNPTSAPAQNAGNPFGNSPEPPLITPFDSQQEGLAPPPEHSTENPIVNSPQAGNTSPAPDHNAQEHIDNLPGHHPIDADGDAVMVDSEVERNQGPIRKSARLPQKEPHIDTANDSIMIDSEVEKHQGPIRKSSRLQEKEPPKLPAVAPYPRRKHRNQHRGSNQGSKATRFAQDGSDLEHAIDVDSFFADNDVSLNVDETVLRVVGHRQVTAYGPTVSSTVTFLVEMHTTEEVESLYMFVDAIVREYPPDAGIDLPLHLTNPSGSAFCILANDQYSKMTTEEILRIFAHQNIVITGMPVEKRPFDVETLETLTTMNTVVPIQDQSIPQDPIHKSYDNRVRQGTLQQLLTCMGQNDGEGGKILNALQFPMPEEGLGRHRFSSDSVAWRATKGRRDSTDGDSPPLADIRWGLAATEGAIHWWHIDSDGFATFLDVITGCKWWIVAREKNAAGPRFGNVRLFLDDYQLDEPNDGLWHLEAILLEPGTRLLMRPNTPHAVYTPDHAICHGGHFYSTPNLQQTLFGIVHAFIAGQLLTNTEHTPSRGLLRRMMQFFYDSLILETGNASSRPHLPDLKSFHSLINVLALCNILILSNALDERTYFSQDSPPDQAHIPSAERYQIAYSRGLSLYFLMALNQKFSVTPNGGPSLLPIIVFAASTLAHQSAAILHYKREAEKLRLEGAIHCTSSLLQEQLEDCLSVWPECLSVFRDLAKRNQVQRGDLEVSMGHDTQFTYQLLAKPDSDTATREFPGHLDILKKGSTLNDVKYFQSRGMNDENPRKRRKQIEAFRTGFRVLQHW